MSTAVKWRSSPSPVVDGRLPRTTFTAEREMMTLKLSRPGVVAGGIAATVVTLASLTSVVQLNTVVLLGGRGTYVKVMLVQCVELFETLVLKEIQ